MAYDNMETSPQEMKLGKVVEKNPDAVGHKTNMEWQLYKQSRQNQEKVWQRALYNLAGRYMPEDLSAMTTKSRAFVQITMPRVQTAVALLVPVIMPSGEPAWTLEASPEPKNSALLQQVIASGASPEDARRVVKAKSELAAERMSLKIQDGLAETNFPTKLMDAVMEFTSFGTMVFTGPYAKEKTDPVTGDTYYCPEVCNESVWDTYIDPAARCVEDAASIIFRKPMSASSFRDLRSKPGFDSKKIDALLNQFGEQGNWTPEWWESSIRDANGQLQQQQSGRYCVLVRWGYLSGKEMRNAGADIPDELLNEQIMCQAWVVDNTTIYVANSELHRDRIPVYMVPYRKKHFSPWGMGVPESMYDSQDAVNAVERAKMDNAALSSKPQVVVYPNLLMPGHNHLEITAGKIWPVQASEIPGFEPVKFMNIPSVFGELDAIQQRHFQFIQETSGIPNVLMGQGGEGVHNRTSTGAQLQFNSSLAPMKSVVFNVESYFIVPMIEKMAAFYKKYDLDPEIEGDYKVVARGLQGMINREAVSQMLLQYMQIAGTVPQWSERLDIERIHTLLTRASGLSDELVTLSDDEVNRRREEAAKQQSTAELANAEAQAQLQAKTRAETAPRDAALEILKRAGEGPLKLAAMQTVLSLYPEINSETMQEAIEQEAELQNYRMNAEAAEMGAKVGEMTAGSKDDEEDMD